MRRRRDLYDGATPRQELAGAKVKTLASIELSTTIKSMHYRRLTRSLAQAGSRRPVNACKDNPTAKNPCRTLPPTVSPWSKLTKDWRIVRFGSHSLASVLSQSKRTARARHHWRIELVKALTAHDPCGAWEYASATTPAIRPSTGTPGQGNGPKRSFDAKSSPFGLREESHAVSRGSSRPSG